MKKEKTVRTYQRRTKTGKLVTVKQHTAKYDATEMLKEAAKKKGAGEELEKLKKKAQVKPAGEPEVKDDALGFTSDEFKQWYHWDMESDPKNKAAKKVEKALKEKMGAKGYKQYFNEMTDSYSARGHNKAFKEISLNTDDPRETAAKMSKYGNKKSEPAKKETTKVKPQKAKESLVEHYDQFNTKYKGKVVGKPFQYKEKETGITYDAQFVTDGKGRYGYVVKDAADGKKGKFYVAIDESSNMAELEPAVRKAAKAAGLTLKNGEWKLASKEATSTKKTKSKESAEAVKDAKAELRGYGSQSLKGVEERFGKDSREYKGYAKLLSSAVPKNPKQAAVHKAVVRGFARAGDDTYRDLLVASGYPHDKAYSEGISEVVALMKKYNMDFRPLKKTKGKRTPTDHRGERIRKQNEG